MRQRGGARQPWRQSLVPSAAAPPRQMRRKRVGWSVFNDSTANLFVKFGVTASTSSFTVKIAPGGYYEMPTTPTYQGQIDGIWDAANGNARVTELVV